MTIKIAGEKVCYQGVIDWYKDGNLVDPASAIHYENKSSLLSGTCISKQLHISDTDDKRKKAQVQVDIFSNQGLPLGTFHSKPIKVISKPSKKRQSLRNMELCIHHGSTVALFNRTRSQTISTKYLGVSSLVSNDQNSGTCFVTRSSAWDPFLIWIVDLSRPPRTTVKNNKNYPPHYPAPPAVAIQAPPNQPMALHYNQPIVLQCLSTGLVSPIMVVRRVDKGSMVMGGCAVRDLSLATGGEFGDEALGDPVSQLHKVAFQIVQDPIPAQYNKARFQTHMPTLPPMIEWTLPQASPEPSYLACMNNVVGMHRVSERRKMVHSFSEPSRKRRMSYQHTTALKNPSRRRVNSLNETLLARHGDAGRQEMNGDCWTEDVSDAATWTLVGTDSVSFCYSTTESHHSAPRVDSVQSGTIAGDHFSSNLSVWLGDVPCKTEFKSKHLLSWAVPNKEILLDNISTQTNPDTNDHKIPVLLAHQDGTIYNSQLYYSF